MAAVTTADLLSIQTVNSLIVEPVFATSVALSSGLARLDTSSTEVYIPAVAGGSAGWCGRGFAPRPPQQGSVLVRPRGDTRLG